MKHLNNLARRTVAAVFAALILTILFGAAREARAQTTLTRPFAQCVEQEYVNGSATGKYIAYFGYSYNGTATEVYPVGGSNNYFSNFTANISGENEISRFEPGIHPRVVSVKVSIGEQVIWVLGASSATASFPTSGSFKNSKLCSTDGANSRLITYQGKLSDGAAAANGTYDLQFQLFNQLTGGTARTSLITLDKVAVAGGVFTVQLDLGANALTDNNSSGSPAGNLKLNPAILDAQNSFFEIGVRAGTSTGAFTTLTPRQPLTAVPLAMRANAADFAYRSGNANFADVARKVPVSSFGQSCSTSDDYGAIIADQTTGKLTVCTQTGFKSNGVNSGSDVIKNAITEQDGNFNVSGNGTIGGNLTVSGSISGALPLTNGAPPASECNASSQYGRQKVDAGSVRLYICTAAGWKSTVLQ